MSCCSSGRYDEVFGAELARRDLRRYRRRGLRRDAADALAFLRRRGIDGASVLEAGGGVGALQVELLQAGAARAVNVELSRGYEEAAAELLGEAGLAGRVERRVADFCDDAVEPADAVVLVRVVCCYPDPDRLVGTAAARAQRLLVLTFPPDTIVARAVAAAANLVLRVSGRGFRTYAHPHRRFHEAAARHGLELVHRGRGRVWQTAGYERTGTMSA